MKIYIVLCDEYGLNGQLKDREVVKSYSDESSAKAECTFKNQKLNIEETFYHYVVSEFYE